MKIGISGQLGYRVRSCLTREPRKTEKGSKEEERKEEGKGGGGIQRK